MRKPRDSGEPSYYAGDYGRSAMCALDFVRALNERPTIMKWLCRLLFGKYAYREFALLVEGLEKDGLMPLFEYGCRNCSYHADKPSWKWWVR